MKKLIEYFIKYPVSANILIVMILLLGWFGMRSLNSTLMPQINPGMIMVTATYPGASPEEIEEGIILKIEDNLKGINGVDKITSVSRENLGTVSVILNQSANADLILQDVKNAVDGISSFPAGMEPPNIRKIEFFAPAVFLTVSGDVELKTLKTYARHIEDELREIDGISKVELSGFPEEEIEISFREDDLKKYNMTFTEAYTAVSAANIDLTGGIIRGEDEELYIRTKQKKYYANNLKEIVLRTETSGAMVLLGNIADVKDKWEETPNKTFIDGSPAVNITINHTAEEDIIHISNTLQEYVDQFNKKHKEVKAQINYDLSIEIDSMQDILLSNGILGFLLVLLFLSLFLNYRLSFWVAFSIPLSFLGMFMIAAFYGLTLNKISLFGMILVIGILVDDGIVIAENIYRHFEKGKSPIRAAIDGTMEVFPAVFSAVLTTIIAFLSFFFLEGVMGQFLVEMAFVVIAVLIFSLIEGAFILPTHIAHSKALKRDRKKPKIETLMTGTIIRFRDKYFAPVLKWSLKNKFATIIIPIALALITIGAYQGGIIKTGDSSVSNEDYVQVSLEMPSGTPEHETMYWLNKIESDIWEVNKEFQKNKKGKTAVKNVQLSLSASNKGTIMVFILGSDERDFHSMDLSNAVRKKVGEIPEAERLNFVQESHFGKPVSLSIKSYDLDELDSARIDFKNELIALEGLKNVVDNYETGMREIKVTLKDKGHILGLSLEDVMNQVRSGFYGLEVQRINRGLDLVKIWVRYDKSDRSSIGKLENMRIRANDGNSYPLKEIANLSYERNLTTINHFNGRRAVTIEADLRDQTVNLSEIKSEIYDKILPDLQEKYPGITYFSGGHQEEMNKASKSLTIVIPIIIILLLVVVTFTFRSFTQTILVFILIPFGFIGMGWGHYIHGYALDLPSYFGMVALMGVMINDAIVLISRFNNLLREGKKFMEAVFEASMSRFRPIILTSLTTIAGLFPLILSPNPHADMVIPMAITVAYGLIIATLLTLILLPVLLVVSNKTKVLIKWARTGTKPTSEEVERAVVELKNVESCVE